MSLTAISVQFLDSYIVPPLTPPKKKKGPDLRGSSMEDKVLLGKDLRREPDTGDDGDHYCHVCLCVCVCGVFFFPSNTMVSKFHITPDTFSLVFFLLCSFALLAPDVTSCWLLCSDGSP